MKTLIILAALLTSTQSFALNLGHQEIAELYKSGKTAEESFSDLKISEAQKKNLITKMEIIAQDLAQIWPDTVLEGPYTQLTDAKLNTKDLMAITYQGEVIGYAAEVIAEGAYTDECEYNYNLAEDLAQKDFLKCAENFKGTLFEKFITDKDGNHVDYFFDPADFTN